MNSKNQWWTMGAMKNAVVAFATSQDAMRTGKDLFGHGEQYAAGAKAGFNCLPRNEKEAPRLELMHYLRNVKSETSYTG